MSLDQQFAANVASLAATVGLPQPLAVFAAQFAAEVASRGVEALYDPQTLWSGEQDLNVLAPQVGGPVASRLREAADCGAQGRDGIIQAICDLCEDVALSADLLDEVLAVRRDVAFSPRRISARQTVYIVQQGDDLRSVALKLYGDPERWREVITTYELQPPYFSAYERGGCLTPGMRLVAGVSRIPDAEVGYLGETMRLRATPTAGRQEWDIVPQPSGGIATVEGSLCLATDCALRLITPLGDLPEHPTYGMPEIPGTHRSSVTASQYLMATETLKEDSRVGQVLSNSRVRGLKLLANVTVVPASSESVEYVY